MKHGFAAAMFLLLTCVTAWAQPVDMEEVRIFSESLRIMDRSGIVEFEGPVRVEVRGVEVSCDHLVVNTSQNDPMIVLSGTATGNVVMVRGEERVEAGKARFDLEKETVELTGSPRLVKGQTIIGAERIIYLLREGTATFQGPVRAVFPGPKE